MKKATLLKFINYWPPFLGAGIRVQSMSKDMRHIEVRMKLRFWNRNYVNTQFGGSLYSMVDPFYMLMLLHNLGKDYIVWDKAATIQFKSPGRGQVRAIFQLSQEQIEQLRQDANQFGKIEPHFQIDILDDQNEIVAVVDKTLYIRRKDANPR